MSSLTDKVAIVTGASKGIGSGIAEALAAAGARVAVNYSSDRTGAERVAQAIIDSGGEAIAIGADVSKAAEVARLFKEVDTAFGRLDVLVNNAGVFRFGAIAEITEESFHLHYNINVLGAILMVQEAIKRFQDSGETFVYVNAGGETFDKAGYIDTYYTLGQIAFEEQRFSNLSVQEFTASPRRPYQSLCVFVEDPNGWQRIAGQTRTAG